MKIYTNIKAQVLALATALSICSSAVCQTIKIYVVNLHTDGTIINLGFDSQLDVTTPPSTTIYQGGLFSTIKHYWEDGNGNPLVEVWLDGVNTGFYFYVYGLNPPNGLSANNVFKAFFNTANSTLTFSALSTGYYQGSGNGCNGRVRALALSTNGDLYTGGDFTQAGGFPYSSKIGVYRASGGWNTSYIFSAWNDVSSLVFDQQTHILTVGGANLWHAQFQGNALNLANNNGYFHTYNGDFNYYCYWTD